MRCLLRVVPRWQAAPLISIAWLCLHCSSGSASGSNTGDGSFADEGGAGGSATGEGGTGSSATGEGGGSATGAGGRSAGDGGSAGEGGSMGEGGSTGDGGSAGEGGGGGCGLPENPAVFEIGTGETCFEHIEDGATLPVMAGPQGGYHLWLAVACGDCGESVRLRYSVRDPATGGLFPSGAVQEGVIPLLPGVLPHASGLPTRLPGAIWDPSSVLPEGTRVILAAEARNDDGSTKHAAQVEVILGATEPWGLPCSDVPETCGAPGGLPCCNTVE
ncbi:hypothetical protein [Sorangium sp. So ce1097]|uniref:hypothetical protein n=1 Tax=Sorangium sp. So ce1097 TaxID=3133330 RepID=UPI003F60AE59